MELDERELTTLIEQSDDLHADAMSATRESLAEMVDLAHEDRAAFAGPPGG